MGKTSVYTEYSTVCDRIFDLSSRIHHELEGKFVEIKLRNPVTLDVEIINPKTFSKSKVTVKAKKVIISRTVNIITQENNVFSINIFPSLAYNIGRVVDKLREELEREGDKQQLQLLDQIMI
ncbi:MAG: hypothetical protein DRJ18_02845 [Candidatus Methanomethylicota archaeon]|nr:MAG: hypothetical protein DRJ18_02845 [Candidatus Verstraetearchaeota archaeon]